MNSWLLSRHTSSSEREGEEPTDGGNNGGRDTAAVEAPRAKERKAGGFPDLPTDLAEEMRTSTTDDIGATPDTVQSRAVY